MADYTDKAIWQKWDVMGSEGLQPGVWAAFCVLDPYDCFMLCKNLGESFESLLSYAIELQVVDQGLFCQI